MSKFFFVQEDEKRKDGLIEKKFFPFVENERKRKRKREGLVGPEGGDRDHRIPFKLVT